MRNSASIEQEIASAQEKIKDLQNKNLGLKAKWSNLNDQRLGMIRNNPLATKQINLDEQAFWLLFLGAFVAICSLVLCGILSFILWAFEASATTLTITASICGGIGGIGLLLLLYGLILKIRVKFLAGKLESFQREIQPLENECRVLDQQIEANQKQISGQETIIEKCNTELKYLPLAKDHLMIYVAEEGSTPNHVRSIRHNITIDGIDYGAASMPFKVIELSPGLHTVKVTVFLYIGGEPHLYASEVSQVRVDSGSIYLRYLFRGPGLVFSPMQFQNPYDFFQYTNQKP